MGQRGAGAAFMPSKFVFPGGRVDASDTEVQLTTPLKDEDHARLSNHAENAKPSAFAAAAIRELWEETGLKLAAPDPDWQGPSGWEAFSRQALGPHARPLSFFFRAITPPGRPRRFDARFFIADADAVSGDPDDFSQAGDELSHLQWIPVSEARDLDLPFITEVVLAEIAQMVRDPAPRQVPFFDHRGDQSVFRTL